MSFIHFYTDNFWCFNGIDLLFPWFMWIMGVSMALSFVSILKEQPRTEHTHNSITSAALAKFTSSFTQPNTSTTGGRHSPPAATTDVTITGTGNLGMGIGAANPSISTSIQSGHDLGLLNPRVRSATGMSSNHSTGTGYDTSNNNSRNIRMSAASTMNDSHMSGLNSVRSISSASNVSVSGVPTTPIHCNTTNPLPDFVPGAMQASTATAEQNTLFNANTTTAGTTEVPSTTTTTATTTKPLTLCGIDLIIWWRVFRRSVLLFLIGMFLANGYEYSTWRIPGVLQYFGVSYFVTGCTILSVHKLTKARLIKLEREYGFIQHHSVSNMDNNTNTVWFKWENLFNKQTIKYFTLSAKAKILTAYSYEWLIQSIILIIYLSIIFGGRVAGCPRGYNGPGGISDNSENFDCTGGIHRYIDMKFFTWQLIYHHPTCLDMYQCRVYDPEGLLGSLSACSLTYLGLMAGRIVLHYKEHNQRMIAWCMGGMVLLFIAGILCGFSREDGIIPINKNLWSTSFVAVTAGGGMIVLSLCYLIIDKYKAWTGAPFRYLGMNSIIIYCGHSLLEEYMPFSYKIYHVNHGTLLQCDVLGTLSWVIIAAYFYHIKFFVKI